ncbi:MAG: peptidase [Candidatus Dadabacteria bacterium]|nr:peptidase [Candidatus Dadabacteria bacterium]
MTFCVGMKVEDGLVGIADTRITSGTEYITARKLTVHEHRRHSLFIMTSGLRSVRDKALTYFSEILEGEDERYDKLYKAVNAFAKQVRRAYEEDKKALEESKLNFDLYSIIGGQFEKDTEHKLYMLYPQANWVEVGKGNPYYIIGESSFGKPILDRALRYDSPMEKALKAGYLAFDATKTSANNVDFPLDIVLYKKNSYKFIEHRYEKDSLDNVSKWWQENLINLVKSMPSEWTAEPIKKLKKISVDK